MSFMGVSKKLEASIGMAMATAFVLTIGSMTSWAITRSEERRVGKECA